MLSPTDPLKAQRELIPTIVYGDSRQAAKAVAGEIAALIRERAAAGKNVVLGLATGSTPVGLYTELVRLHREDKLSFKNVISFNLDEYYPIQPRELQSYVRFMNENLFDHIDIERKNVHIPDGTLPLEKVVAATAAYEKAIDDAGGIDIQILGIGRTGHIGFNEPGSGRYSRTRLITLDRMTRHDAASDFGGETKVPRRAITMGVGTILKSRRIIIMAWGEHKAPIVARTIEGAIAPSIPATFLQEHPHVQFVLDQAAASELTRTKTPWVLGPVDWTPALTRKAVISLAQHLSKPILKLTDEDYNEGHLQDLLALHGSSYSINIEVFRALQNTITGWPGGKPDPKKRPGDRSRATDSIFPKRVLIFSPHPDDDVISMGGTLIRLVDQGHEVHVAYQVSGNLAVFDADAARFAEFAAEFNAIMGIENKKTREINQQIDEFLKNKKPDQVDTDQVRAIKGLIRRTEARAACRSCNIPPSHAHFMDLPFYESGRARKKPLSEEDIRITAELLEKIKPHQIYAAGDLADPHGTHRICLSAIFRAVDKIKTQDWFKQCEVWLYRGAWAEWPVDEIEMAVPISPQELMRKRMAIFKHQSQKDGVMFPGADSREFWQRAEDRNRGTAQIYDKLGLAEYEAMEGFVQWQPGKFAI